MLIAAECEAHQGLHVSAENLIVEIVVRETNAAGVETVRAAEPGEMGEVVVTDLHNRAMPFIRYANGDVASFAAGGTCPCGRTLPRLAEVEGRVTETLTDAAGNRVNGLVFNVIIAHLHDAIREFQVVQRRDRSITLRVVPGPQFGTLAETSLQDVWRRYLPNVRFTLEKVERIDVRPGGKRRVVIVER
jgi:phenylacetate-CoA ligase